MEDKAPVVIQGKTLQRKRQAERLNRNRYNYKSPAKPERETNTYSLSTLRESRSSTVMGKPRIRPRTGTKGWAGRQSYSRVTSSKSVASPGGPRPRMRNEEAIPQNNSLMIKIAVSVLLALLVILLNYIQLPFTQTIVGHVRTALTQEFDLDETLGKLKFVGEILPDEIKAVFGQESHTPVFASPARGKVVHTFGEQITLPTTGKAYGNQGIDIETSENAPFFASADGVVAAVEEHEIYGPSLWLDHGDRIFSFYGRCGEIDVIEGDKVRRGQKMGVVITPTQGQSILHFQIWKSDKPENPLEWINQAGQEGKGEVYKGNAYRQNI